MAKVCFSAVGPCTTCLLDLRRLRALSNSSEWACQLYVIVLSICEELVSTARGEGGDTIEFDTGETCVLLGMYTGMSGGR